MSFSPTDFRHTMGRFATGITVVTTLNGAEQHAITVNSFASVSLNPPLILICIDRHTEIHNFIATSGVFTVNILNAKQQPLSDRYAGRDPEKRTFFGDVPHYTGVNGCLVFKESIASIECRLYQTYDGGDHSIYVGYTENLTIHAGLETDSSMLESGPLLYYKSAYQQLNIT